MKSILFLFLCAILFFACRKDNLITGPALNGGISFYFINAGDSSKAIYSLIPKAQNVSNYSLITVDIDKDGTNDVYFYEFAWFDPVSWQDFDSLQKMNTSIGFFVNVDSKGYPLVLKKGDRIDSSLTWRNAGKGIIMIKEGVDNYPGGIGPYQVGHWSGISGGYMGVKIIKNNIVYYGWIRGNTTPYLQMTDFAYRK